MKLHKWDNYEAYVEAQCHGSRRRAHRKPSANELEFTRIAEYVGKNKHAHELQIICHGARCGTEVKLFEEHLPGSQVVGTDLEPKDTERVIKWDFHKTKPEWVGAFDVVYSNSLDHSIKPLQCVRGWLGQLKPDGLLFVTWTFYSPLDERQTLPYPGGDCFGAELSEYVKLMSYLGILRDLLWVPIGHGQVVLVTSPRPPKQKGK
jgi:hypothetical protein